MKRRKLKKSAKVVLIGGLLALLAVNFVSNFGKVTKDDLGNTCRGGIIKICSRG
jgi:hypothetical protein